MATPFVAGRNSFRRREWNFCSKLLFETNDSVDSLQLTTTCCKSRRRPSERWTRGARPERVRAVTSPTERVRAVWADARADLLSEHESVAASRGVLFVAPGGCAAHCPKVYSARLLTSSPLSFGLRSWWLTTRGLQIAVARTRRTATGKPRASRNRSIDSACEARRATRRSCASRSSSVKKFYSPLGMIPLFQVYQV